MINNLVKKDTSSILNIAKILSILCVILAHSRINDYSYYSHLAERLGCLGVVTFFFIAGYFFNISKYGFVPFFKKKVTSIFIPWLFWGSVVFIISNSPKNIISWLNWMIGNGTYLYYLTMLIICYLLFSISENKVFCYSAIFLNVTSLLLTSFNILESHLEINNYLNPFNWIGFFALGILLKNIFFNFLIFINKHKFKIIVSYIFFLLISINLEIEHGYFSKFAVINEVLGMITIFSISCLKFFSKQSILKIAGYTFTVYLIHFVVFPIRKFLIVNHITQFFNPLIYLFFCLFIIAVGRYIATKIKLLKLYNILLGIR